MVVTPAGDPCIIAVPYQGTLNFAPFSTLERSASRRVTLATNGTQESKIKMMFHLRHRLANISPLLQYP